LGIHLHLIELQAIFEANYVSTDNTDTDTAISETEHNTDTETETDATMSETDNITDTNTEPTRRNWNDNIVTLGENS
jgi:hypothetical protein